MKIGITFNFGANIWSNGLQANAVSLYNLLEKIDFVEEVKMLKLNNEQPDDTVQSLDFKIDEWNTITSERIREDYDLIISLGVKQHDALIDHFKQNEDNRIVQYRCGNNLGDEIGNITFNINDGKGKVNHYKGYHETWTLPHHAFHNQQYFEIVYESKTRILPYIWSDFQVSVNGQNYKNAHNSPWFDDQNFEKWSIGSFEPPGKFYKFMLPNMYSLDYAARLEPNMFEKFIMFNSISYTNSERLLSMVNELKHKHKFSFPGRYPLPYVLSEHVQMAITSQHHNDLNNLYLDLAYFGTPLVHNSEFIADMGYYYKGFNLKDAGELVVKAAKERKKDTDYTARHLRILDRYNPMAEDMIHQHARLIENLWKKNEIDEMVYDMKTNRLVKS